MNRVLDSCGPAPARLRTALKAHREIPTAWFRKTWERTLSEYVPLFRQIGDEVRRADVFAIAQDIETDLTGRVGPVWPAFLHGQVEHLQRRLLVSEVSTPPGRLAESSIEGFDAVGRIDQLPDFDRKEPVAKLPP